MMKDIPVNGLQVGSMYTEPVYIEENNLLVPAGIAIRKKDIQRLVAWGIETVHTEGVIAPPGTKFGEKGAVLPGGAAGEALKSFPLPQAPENQEAHRLYIGLIDGLDDVFNDIIDERRIDVRAIDILVDRLIQAVREQRQSMIGYILGEEVVGRDSAKSAVNTAILSCLIATEFKALNQKSLQIVTGALLHDVGMLRLPRQLLDTPERLSGTELRQMQTHPPASYKIVCKELLYPQGVGMVVLQHHEHWDGTGYPQGLAGAKIDPGARIVSVADAFDAMISKKPYRESMIGYQAMKNLLADNSRCFDPTVLKVFIKTMGIYPIGSFVLLSNRAIARITEVRTDAPMRPKVCLVVDESGKALPKDQTVFLDLLNEKKLFIVRALDPREFAKHHE
ncbi:MAG: HD-GYP domain-containing protein [Spirochaetaceae bacterium]|jgi:HD-GYP domain-containing protein (c-di-GMP phosphodiesterase class II)|nr:HD-GYP domain-containing protein [Spirochaetaceae bacterium]